MVHEKFCPGLLRTPFFFLVRFMLDLEGQCIKFLSEFHDSKLLSEFYLYGLFENKIMRPSNSSVEKSVCSLFSFFS